MTLSIPEDLHHIVKKHSEIKWSEIARRAMWDYANKLEQLDVSLKGSEMSQVDAADIGKKVKKGIQRRHLEKSNETGS